MFKRKGIPIMLDRKRHLRLELAGVSLFENLTRKPLFLRETLDRLTGEELAILLYCSLLHEGLTNEQVKRIYAGLTLKSVSELGRKLSTAWLDAQKSLIRRNNKKF